MSRQVIVSTIPVLDEEQQAGGDALVAFADLMRTKEGCLAFDVFRSTASPGSFVTIAQWVDRATFEAHRDSPEVAALMQSAQGRLSGAPTIDPLEPVDAVEA